ncbi:hypothetical protein CF392_05385 [Tamilnaduibacter salinus]|uniref:Uncharacterized protein n=1 Tax=Tamilnaduibacter salinus TaxID=1484056 RepID=A0A2A2I685_9GAMM|nr:hypothetical protein [Tamilnaduibacter salinus]PAV26640.1 hypothetical protein CF392_05385 [Tamilnaduibacter salinus]
MFRKLAVVLLVTSLSACGGGGDGDGENVKTISLNQKAEVAVEERSSATFTARYEITDIRPVDSDPALELSASGKQIKISSKELEYPVLATFNVSMTDGNNRLVQRLEVIGVNISARYAESLAETLEGEKDRILALANDQRVYDFFVDVAYLDGSLSSKERFEKMSAFDPGKHPNYANAKQAVESAIETYHSYLRGESKERRLKSATDQAKSELRLLGDYGQTQFDKIKPIVTAYISPIPEVSFAFVEEKRVFTRFFDPAIAKIDSETGNVTFKEGFDVLNPILL